MVEFGWCRKITDVRLLKDCGFDYIECPLALLSLEDEATLRKELPAYKESPLPIRAFHGFLPADIKIIGPHAEPDRIRRYIAAAAGVLDETGARIAVLGSPQSRSIPAGWEQVKAEEQLMQVLQWVADEFSGTQAKLVLEPLNTKETNFINTVSEAVKYAALINRPQIRVMADFYHLCEDNEPLDNVITHKDWLAHVHVADTNRLSPGTGSYPYERFFANLRNAGYTGMISAECTVMDINRELPISLGFLKSVWEKTGHLPA